MKMTIGSDGITKCNDVCNPDNFMRRSCNEYCKGFIFAIPKQLPTTTSNDQYWWIAPVIIGMLVIATIVLSLCNWKKIQGFVQQRTGRRLQPPTTVAVIESANEINFEDKVPDNENASDSGISNDDSVYIDIEGIDTGRVDNGIDGHLIEDRKPLLYGRRREQQNVAQENDNDNLDTPVIAIGQEPKTKYVVTTPI